MNKNIKFIIYLKFLLMNVKIIYYSIINYNQNIKISRSIKYITNKYKFDIIVNQHNFI